MEARGGGELLRGDIDVAGVRRSYSLAPAPAPAGQAPPPLLIALHGTGADGRAMAWSTGLGLRGPAAGITVAFPDGWKGAWHQDRPPAGQPSLDDARFLAELASHLEAAGAARSWPVFLAGVSQGARYAEHLARHGLLPVTGLFLVAGTALAASRRRVPLPQLRASMIMVMGTGDTTAPYAGGQLARPGISGRLRRRRAARQGELPGDDMVAGAEDVVTDWATANGITDGGAPAAATARPAIEELPASPGDLPVTRKTWSRPGCHSATLYRIDGGGHGWPGGRPPGGARAGATVAGHPDATGLLLDMAERESAIARGRHPALSRGGTA